ncbi:MAG: hypothetical protein AABY30_05415 [Candidatus Thermoplasmatota archaeon]
MDTKVAEAKRTSVWAELRDLLALRGQKEEDTCERNGSSRGR